MNYNTYIGIKIQLQKGEKMGIQNNQPSTRYVIQRVTDGEKIIQVIHAAFQRYLSDPMPSSALKETANTIERNLADGILIIGAYCNEELVGVVKATPLPHAYYFSRLAVLPTHQKKGIASLLIQAVEQLAKENRKHLVQCEVRKSETDNIRLYKKLSYHITKENEVISPLGFQMTTVTMEKYIN